MSSFVHNIMILVKIFFRISRTPFIDPSFLFDCIERAFKKAHNEAIAFGYERKGFKPQKVFQGFKNLGSLPLCLSIFFSFIFSCFTLFSCFSGASSFVLILI